MTRCKKELDKARVETVQEVLDALTSEYEHHFDFMSFTKLSLLGGLWDSAKPILEANKEVAGCVLAYRMYYMDRFAYGVFCELFPEHRVDSQLFENQKVTDFIMQAGSSTEAFARITGANYLGMLDDTNTQS